MRLTEDGEGREEQQQVEREFGHRQKRCGAKKRSTRANSASQICSEDVAEVTGSGRHRWTDCERVGVGRAEEQKTRRAASERSRLFAPAQPPPPPALSLSLCLSKVAKYYYYCFFYDLTLELFSPCFDSRARPNNFLRRQDIVKQIWCKQ